MTVQKLSVVVIVLNLLLLVALLANRQPASAQDIAPVLRGRALQIVDEQGRVRASIGISTNDGAYPENVVFRLHDRAGKPTVKLETHEGGVSYPKGSGLGLLGDSDDTQAFIGTEGPTSKVDLKNRGGQRQQIRP